MSLEEYLDVLDLMNLEKDMMCSDLEDDESEKAPVTVPKKAEK